MNIRSAKVLLRMLVFVGVVGLTAFLVAGQLDPSNPPGPTMHTLNEIYNAVNASSNGISEREGHCKYYEAPIGQYTDLITVPAGKRFVLLKLNVNKASTDWRLLINDEVLFDGYIVYLSSDPYNYWWDFPDRCVVVEGGDTLKAYNGSDPAVMKIHLIGYFYNVQ